MARITIEDASYYDVEDVEKTLGVNERTAYNIIKKYVPEAGLKKFNNDPQHKRGKKYIEERYFYNMCLDYQIDKGYIDVTPTEKDLQDQIAFLQSEIKNILSRCVIFYGNKDYPYLNEPVEGGTCVGANFVTGKMERKEFDEIPFDFHIMNEKLFEKWKKDYFEKHNIKENDEN